LVIELSLCNFILKALLNQHIHIYFLRLLHNLDTM